MALPVQKKTKNTLREEAHKVDQQQSTKAKHSEQSATTAAPVSQSVSSIAMVLARPYLFLPIVAATPQERRRHPPSGPPQSRATVSIPAPDPPILEVYAPPRTQYQ